VGSGGGVKGHFIAKINVDGPALEQEDKDGKADEHGSSHSDIIYFYTQYPHDEFRPISQTRSTHQRDHHRDFFEVFPFEEFFPIFPSETSLANEAARFPEDMVAMFKLVDPSRAAMRDFLAAQEMAVIEIIAFPNCFLLAQNAHSLFVPHLLLVLGWSIIWIGVC